jgi:hypothetical protein
MSPFSSLYGRKCNILVRWDNPIDKSIIELYLLKETKERMTKIKQIFKNSRDRTKSYADQNNFFIDFKVGENVFLKVKEKISSIRLG